MSKIGHVGHASTTLSEALMHHMALLDSKAEVVFAQHNSPELEEELGIRRRGAEMTFPPIMELIPDKIDYPQDMSERQARRKVVRKLTSPVKAKYRGKTNPFKK